MSMRRKLTEKLQERSALLEKAEGLLNDAIDNLAEKQRFDLTTPAQQARYRAACRGCADAYRLLARTTGQRSMWLRAALLRMGLPVYKAFLRHKGKAASPKN